MSQYYGNTRTNYFRVTDESKYNELFSHLICDGDDISDFTKVDKDGIIWHGFGGYGTIDFIENSHDDDMDYNFDLFIKELQKILPEDEAFIMFESGHEKLCYVIGYALVVTKNDCKHIELRDWAAETAKEMLNNPKFRTITEY